MTNTDKAREAFEHWYTKGNKDCPSIQRTENRGKGELPYRLMQAQHAWGAWQAAWESLQPKAVDVETLKRDFCNLLKKVVPREHFDNDGYVLNEEEIIDKASFNDCLYEVVPEILSYLHQQGLLSPIPEGYVMVSKQHKEYLEEHHHITETAIGLTKVALSAKDIDRAKFHLKTACERIDAARPMIQAAKGDA